MYMCTYVCMHITFDYICLICMYEIFWNCCFPENVCRYVRMYVSKVEHNLNDWLSSRLFSIIRTAKNNYGKNRAKSSRVEGNHGRNGKNAIMENYGKLRKAPTKPSAKRILWPFLFWLAFHGHIIMEKSSAATLLQVRNPFFSIILSETIAERFFKKFIKDFFEWRSVFTFFVLGGGFKHFVFSSFSPLPGKIMVNWFSKHHIGQVYDNLDLNSLRWIKSRCVTDVFEDMDLYCKMKPQVHDFDKLSIY